MKNDMESQVVHLPREHLNKNLRAFPLTKALKQKLMQSEDQEYALEIGPICTVYFVYYICIYGII